MTAGTPRARRCGPVPPGSGRRLVAGAGALLVAAAGLVVGAPAAGAAACSGSSGVTVVVDFGSLGGGVQTGCAGGDPGSGLAALSAAGHGYTFVPRQVGLVCQIDARPNPCNGAPTTAYWSYWHATRGGSWRYGTVGAGGYNPQPGTVEGWAFGAGRQPGIAPPAAPAPPPPPAPKPTTKPVPGPSTQPPPAPVPAHGSAAGGGAARTTAPRGATGSTSRSPAGTTAAPSTSAGPTATDGTSASSTGAVAAPSTSDSGLIAVEAAQRPPPPRYPWKRLLGSALAVALIVTIAVAGILIARRRRTQPPA